MTRTEQRQEWEARIASYRASWVRRPEIGILNAQIEHEDRKSLSTVSAWIEQEQ